MKITKRLKLYLVENNISQKSVAEVTGIAPVKLSQSLNGNRKMTFEEFELILGAIGETADKFIKPRKIN